MAYSQSKTHVIQAGPSSDKILNGTYVDQREIGYQLIMRQLILRLLAEVWAGHKGCEEAPSQPLDQAREAQASREAQEVARSQLEELKKSRKVVWLSEVRASRPPKS